MLLNNFHISVNTNFCSILILLKGRLSLCFQNNLGYFLRICLRYEHLPVFIRNITVYVYEYISLKVLITTDNSTQYNLHALNDNHTLFVVKVEASLQENEQLFIIGRSVCFTLPFVC